MQTINIQNSFQCDTEVGNAGATHLTVQATESMHANASMLSAKQGRLSGPTNVTASSVASFLLAWYIPFAIWRDAIHLCAIRTAMAKQFWLELSRFACETGIQSPHEVTSELLWEYLHCMDKRGLTPAARRDRLAIIQSVFRLLSDRQILKSNPASRLAVFPLMPQVRVHKH